MFSPLSRNGRPFWSLKIRNAGPVRPDGTSRYSSNFDEFESTCVSCSPASKKLPKRFGTYAGAGGATSVFSGPWPDGGVAGGVCGVPAPDGCDDDCARSAAEKRATTRAMNVRFMSSSSPSEVRPRRRVRAVDVVVAVAAAVLDRAVARVPADDRVAQVVERARVPRAQVTPLAEPRQLRDEQTLVIRSVRRVARRAVLANGRVFPQERAALVRVAGVTKLVDRIRFQKSALRVRMRVVTVAAVELSLADRVMALPHHLRPDLRVARVAGLAGARRLQLRALRLERVNAMARRAGKPAALVDAAQPVRLTGVVMTGQAVRAHLRCRHRLHRDDGTAAFAGHLH